MKSGMKTLVGLAAGLAVAVALPVSAADSVKPKGAAKPHWPEKALRAPAAPGSWAQDISTTRIITMLDRRADLTEEQERQIRGILDETRAEAKALMDELRGKMKASREGILKVLTDEQKQKIGKAAGQLLGGVADFADTHGPALRERLQAAGDEIRMRGALASLELTEEQREKLRAHHEAMRERHEALRKEMGPKIQALREEARKELESILTPEQREQLKERLETMPADPPRGPRFGEGGLGQQWRDRRAARFDGLDGPDDQRPRGRRRGDRPDLPPPPPPDDPKR
jgi:Spy/CpxP family protein refolding chaperone